METAKKQPEQARLPEENLEGVSGGGDGEPRPLVNPDDPYWIGAEDILNQSVGLRRCRNCFYNRCYRGQELAYSYFPTDGSPEVKHYRQVYKCSMCHHRLGTCV